MNPQRGTPTLPGARHEPTTGQTRPQLLFARVTPGGAAHTVPPGSRGGRPPSPRRAAPSLSVSSPPARGLAPQPNPAPLANHRGWAAAPGALPPGGRPPRLLGTRGGDLHTSAGTTDVAAGPLPTPPYQTPCGRTSSDPLQGAKPGGRAPNKEQRRRRSLAAEPPLPAAGPHTRPPGTSDSERARVSKLFPCALRADDPPAGPLSSRRRSDESQTSFRRRVEQPSRELLGLRAPPPGPRGRPAHSTTGIVCPRRFPPPPPHTQRVSCLGA